MKILTRTMPVNFNLFCFGDTHEGSEQFAQKGLGKLLNIMNSEYEGLPEYCNYGVFHGDAIEAIMVDDKRYDPKTSDNPFPLSQMEEITKKLKPIQHKLIAFLDGNHEIHLHRFGNLSAMMAKWLNVPYGTYTARILYFDKKGRLIFKHYATHGRKPINSTADDPKRRITNMELILKRHLKFKANDCALLTKGHCHKIVICRPTSELYIADDGKKLKQKYTVVNNTADYIHPDHQWFASTGSFLRLYGENVSGYGEQKEYDPTELGCIVVLVRNKKITDVNKLIFVI